MKQSKILELAINQQMNKIRDKIEEYTENVPYRNPFNGIERNHLGEWISRLKNDLTDLQNLISEFEKQPIEK